MKLTQEHIQAATRLRKLLPDWQCADAALTQIGEKFPGYSGVECLVKTVAVNAIYHTGVIATTKMAKHVCKVMSQPGAVDRGPDLVDELSMLHTANGKVRQQTSFAAKFCHFYVNADRFLIYDDAAREVLDLHLGQKRVEKHAGYSYARFSGDFDRLRIDAGLQCTTRELDRYLWLTGMYLRWLRERTRKTKRVNAELKELFEHPSAEQAPELHALLPAHIERTFALGQ